MVWRRTTKFDDVGRRLADRHYSRQSVGSPQFLPPGKTLALVTDDELAVWGVCENVFRESPRWRVTIFRNEGPLLSSRLIELATHETFEHWRGRFPACDLTTEVDPLEVQSPNPGWCFLCAGWTRVRVTAGSTKGRRNLHVFRAPMELAR